MGKNKKGKEVSDFDKYKPWSGEEFSGKLEYELDNKEKYEIHEIYINEYGKWFEIQNGEKEEIYNIIHGTVKGKKAIMTSWYIG